MLREQAEVGEKAKQDDKEIIAWVSTEWYKNNKPEGPSQCFQEDQEGTEGI